jgi:predicted MFS family arabinose efflux permease
MNNNSSYKWVVLAFSFFLMIGFALSLQALPPLFEHITKTIHFSNSQAGILMGAYAIPGIFLPFLIANLTKRFGIKRMLIAALIIMIFGLVSFSFANSYLLLLIFRLLAGVGATVLVVLSPLMITIYFDRKNIGVGMGIFNIAVPLGTVLAANLIGLLITYVSWQIIILGIAVFLGIIFILLIFILKLDKEADNSAEKLPTQIKGNYNLWFLAAIWALANAQMLAYMTFGSQFFQTIGFPTQSAGFLTSLIMLISIFLAPLVGILFDKSSKKKFYLIMGVVITFVSFIFIGFNFLNITIWAVALGIGFTPIPVFVFTQLPEMVKAHEVGIGLGILTMTSNIGTSMGPAALGLIVDLSKGKFLVAFISLAIISLIVLFFSLKINLLKKR